jgi:hypothetical protein
MTYRNSTPEEINLIAKFLTEEFEKAEELIFGRIPNDDEKIDSFQMAQNYFYSTLETPYGYKIVTLFSFEVCPKDNACDMFQERFIIFDKDNKVQSISECDWVSTDETYESLTIGKKESEKMNESNEEQNN